MNREKMPRNIDKEVYKNTASKGKAINLNARLYRGGIRL